MVAAGRDSRNAGILWRKVNRRKDVVGDGISDGGLAMGVCASSLEQVRPI